MKMNGKEVLKPKAKIRGGIKLPHLKSTAECQTDLLKTVKTVTIPMVQHIGAPCTPTVKKGDEVFVGTLIGDCPSPVCAPIHSSVSGKVLDVKNITLATGAEGKAVIIENDGSMTPDPSLNPVEVKTPEQLVLAAKNSGLVGLGGAGFPSHIKLNIKEGTVIDTLIINGAECEPFITSDYRSCIENTDDILEGVYLIKNILGIKNVIIAVEDNKPKAIEALYTIAADKNDEDNSVKIMKLPSKYPQGAEKVLIYSATGRKLPLGKLPSDVGCIVMNVTSVATLNRYIKTGMPLVSKCITVDGSGVENGGNVIVPIGTPISDVLEHYKVKEYNKILFGGPMMGIAVSDISLPITKQNNALLVLNGAMGEIKNPDPCIKCGRCLKACPMGLTPAAVDTALNSADAKELEALNVMYCMECGSCAFGCPATRPLVQSMRLAKSKIRKAGKK